MNVSTLESTVSDITARLRQGRYPNEHSVSQGIVLRLLQELGWDTYDISSVWPEYQTGEGRADFALCHPPSKPAVFIEVKQPGRAEESVRQALEYAFHTGVPFIVLTASSKPSVEPIPRTGGSRSVATASPVTTASARAGKLVLRGKAYSYHNAIDAMVIVLCELAKGDPTFLERCSQHPDAQGRKRHYIARTPEELYPDREDLRVCRQPLPGGWFVATNINNILKRTIIKLAAEVAGLSFGKDVIVEF